MGWGVCVRDRCLVALVISFSAHDIYNDMCVGLALRCCHYINNTNKEVMCEKILENYLDSDVRRL